jgi:hypothetical protein
LIAAEWVYVEVLLPGPLAGIEVIFREQRDRDLGALPAAGLGINVSCDAPKHNRDFEPRLLNPLQ